VLIEEKKLRRFVTDIFLAARSSPEEAEIVAGHLVEANLTGHDSHGVSLIPDYLDNLAAGNVNPNTAGKLASAQGSMLVYDGQRGYGQVVARNATNIAIDVAREHGVAVLALRNSYHVGRIGAYGELCAARGLVSVHFVNATGHQPRVAPYGGRDARLPTNPFCVAIPASDRHPSVVLDMATSRIAQGKVRVARNSGLQVPPGCLLDSRGEPTTDPAVMFDSPPGALLPFGEHKGFALGLVCELLGGALAGGLTIQPGNQRGRGVINHMLAIVFDPTRLTDMTHTRHEMDALIDYVLASPAISNASPVVTPGTPERANKADRQRNGVDLDTGTWDRLVAAARKIAVAPPD
jgi:hydroxycarboxylate dehydrogenase B